MAYDRRGKIRRWLASRIQTAEKLVVFLGPTISLDIEYDEIFRGTMGDSEATQDFPLATDAAWIAKFPRSWRQSDTSSVTGHFLSLPIQPRRGWNHRADAKVRSSVVLGRIQSVGPPHRQFRDGNRGLPRVTPISARHPTLVADRVVTRVYREIQSGHASFRALGFTLK